MMKKNKQASLITTALGVIALTTSSIVNAGSIIIAGHDTDETGHSSQPTQHYMEWAITYLITGDGSTPPAASQTSSKIAFLGNRSINLNDYLGVYDNYGFYDLDNANWTDVFSDNNDIIIIGSGNDYISSAGSNALNAEATAFASFFNNSGSLFINTNDGANTGAIASFYDFIPGFGTTNNDTLPGCNTGAPDCMRATTAGAAVGMKDALINEAGITHTRFNNIDPTFTALEFYYNRGPGSTGYGDAITISLFDGSIDDGGFVNNDPNPVPEPATLGLIGLGIFGLAATRRRKQ